MNHDGADFLSPAFFALIAKVLKPENAPGRQIATVDLLHGLGVYRSGLTPFASSPNDLILSCGEAWP
jgi:hypothetical protein